MARAVGAQLRSTRLAAQSRNDQAIRAKDLVTRHNRRMEAAPASLAAVVGRIDRDQLAGTMLSAFRDEIPGYARLPESVIQGQIMAVIRENLDLCLDWVAGAAEPDSKRFDEFRASARNRAREGMPLEDLLHAYRMGGTAGWRAIVAEATPGERDALPQAAELVMTYLDQASGIVAAAA